MLMTIANGGDDDGDHLGSLVGVGVEEAADDKVDLAADEQNQQQLLHLVRWGFSGKKLGWLEEKHILGAITSPGDPHHDDNDYDGNNDEENQQQLLHLVRWWLVE